MLLSALGPDPDTPQPVLEEELPETSPLPTSTVVSKFGDYELLEELAHGGMGVVYKARQVKLDRLVVVKMLLLGQRASDEVVERFKREAQAAARLRHPNIVAIHEVGEVDGQPFFSMDYVPGKDLAKIVRERPLPAREAATYMRAVAEAIHYAHQQGIVHRDIKPSNILVDSATNEVRVTDFGLAKRMDDDSDLTLSGQVMGSPNHMAPELAAGHHRQASPASDVFSLGTVLYELLTGRPPFLADSLQATLLKIRDADPVTPRELNARIPRDLETLCLKCLEKEPGARFETAQELAEELGRFLRGEPIRTRPAGVLEKTWRWCQRKPALAGLAAAIVALAVVSSMAAIGLAVARQQQAREQYYAEIGLAKAQIEEGNIDRAMELLLHCPPRFRHWEWGHLLYLCHQDIRTIPAHTSLFSTTDIQVQYLMASVTRMEFSPDSRSLITLGADGVAKVWDVAEGRLLYSCGSPSNRLNLLACSPDGTRLAVAQGNQVTLRDTRSDVVQLQLPVSPGTITQLAWHPDGQRLALGLEDGDVAIHDAANGNREILIPASGGSIAALFYTPDGHRLVRQDPLRCVSYDSITGREQEVFSIDRKRSVAVVSDREMRRFVEHDSESRINL
jgi:tRNA A-37 threonylcarbamoyl transferase component Bud32